MEIWKDINGFEGLYQVSNCGNVFSLKSKRLLKQDECKGYRRVTLTTNGKTKHFLVHRLVALTFIPNENNYDEINHKDENSLNNNADNLEWCSHKYNINYGTRNKRAGNSRIGKGRRIYQYSKSGELLKEWTSTMDIQRQLNIHHTHISRCCRGGRKSAGGFVWKYEKEA